jgi:glycine/D-amino acid oxidase-like deaminating enzyme
VSPDAPGSAAVGLLVRTPPVVADVRRVVHPPGLALRPDGGGRLLLHGHAFDSQVAVDMPASLVSAVADQLVETVRPYVRHMEHRPVASAAVGIRPLPVDGVSVAGWVPAVEGLYVVVTHSGVTLAPILAALAAKEVHGATEPLLAPFRPQRFTT